ncbi:non-ribosomal peptide synthetase, partial [Escherichia coli]
INLNQQLKVYDLSHLNSMEATIQLEILRDEYRHFSHDLSTPPWQIAWIQLPETFEEQTVVLTSFDGLIIDGYSISVILNSLFDVNQDLNLLDKDQNLDAQQNHSSFFDATEKDRDFWHNALSQVEELHPLPWANALESIDTP